MPILAPRSVRQRCVLHQSIFAGPRQTLQWSEDCTRFRLQKPPRLENSGKDSGVPLCNDLPVPIFEVMDEVVWSMCDPSSSKQSAVLGDWSKQNYKALFLQSERVVLGDIPLFGEHAYPYIQSFRPTSKCNISRLDSSSSILNWCGVSRTVVHLLASTLFLSRLHCL